MAGRGGARRCRKWDLAEGPGWPRLAQPRPPPSVRPHWVGVQCRPQRQGLPSLTSSAGFHFERGLSQVSGGKVRVTLFYRGRPPPVGDGHGKAREHRVARLASPGESERERASGCHCARWGGARIRSPSPARVSRPGLAPPWPWEPPLLCSARRSPGADRVSSANWKRADATRRRDRPRTETTTPRLATARC